MRIQYGVVLSILCFGLGAAGAYPPAKGFHEAGSDAKAIAVADAVMDAMGGWENWNQTRYVTWRFFGGRLHVWDKWTGNIRFEQGGLVVLMNINTQEGKVYRNGMAETEPDSIKKYLNRGYRAWVNDSYWLVMPYKLKDSGVTLKYGGETTLTDGRPAHMLTLTFEEVGVTPQNMYHVYVDKKTNMVAEWEYFPKASDPEPRFRGLWENWTKYGKIMLSDGRGNRKHTDLAVFDTLPASVFESPEPVDMMGFVK